MIGPRVELTGSADKFLWIYLGIFLLIVFVIVYFLGRSIGKKQQGSQLLDEIKNDNLTYQKSQYIVFADKLYSAMIGFGTDEDSIYSVFRKMNTDDDVKQLIVAFGSKRIEFTIGGSTLAEWLVTELSESEMTELNNILSQRNINFSF